MSESEMEALKRHILSHDPTGQQIDAIFSENLEFLLRAAPGSGKTWTSCRRFIWRGANWHYKVGGLALLSFTNIAIREFQESAIRLGKQELLSDPNYVGTFDSFVERFILTPYGHTIKNTPRSPKLFISPRLGDRSNESFIISLPSKNGRRQNIFAWEIVPCRNEKEVEFRDKRRNLIPKDYALRVLDAFMSRGFYTHEQRCFWACVLLSKNHRITEVISRRFPEIIIDEAQDSNPWLIVLLNFLRNQGSKITLIGDPDQCIYEFNYASSTSLQSLKEKWNLDEKPLSQSFRFNNAIAQSVKRIGLNPELSGYGESENPHFRPYIIRDEPGSFAASIATFSQLLDCMKIERTSSAILCRGRKQLNAIRGQVAYTNLKGVSKDLAKASFLRDCHNDFPGAAKIVTAVLKDLSEDHCFWEDFDENQDSDEYFEFKFEIWDFVKSAEKLPSSQVFADEWLSQIRRTLPLLVRRLGLSDIPNLNRKLTMRGLAEDRKKAPLFIPEQSFPNIRHETIHGVKGESIDAVLLLGDAGKFWTPVVKAIQSGENSEVRRLAYVAMTRARHLLVLGLPSSHYETYSNIWKEWGFEELDLGKKFGAVNANP
ncbi:UvrD-helicase domain-containing protein [Halomicronema sp. CCY15110]|uniref:UvrD-helicase domain-containing protein n=1 Tax=Halomicronema sp. CCY15110 TaxID=2767773 RepID=UPI00194E1B99|nr:ATP-dependent helicase [Halomicronema sp. CCY15110]